MLIAITFPVDQVVNFRLTSTLNNSVVKHLLYCPFRVINHSGGRWWWLCATITLVWLNERHMEHTVNLMHAVWKIQTVSSAAHASQVFAWSNSSRNKLVGTSDPQMQASGG